MRWPDARVWVLVAAAAVGAACAAPIDVATERANRIAPASPPNNETLAEAETVPAPPTSLGWSSCAAFDIPDIEFLGTSQWECATLETPMDPFDDRAGDGAAGETVQLALTRHAATGERRGSLLLNPGGPGGSGLDFAWAIRSAFPAELLRSFDIVGWDPRGVGRSTPAITCGDAPDLDDDFLMRKCAEATGDLAAHLAAPYTAGDMEAIRRAIGETRLNYLGYSYGTTLGAIYAARYPESVGRFVLDGATHPSIGSADGPFEDGFPFYAEDGVGAASDRFDELCDASSRCQLAGGTFDAIDQLILDVADLPTDDFDGQPEVVDGELLSGLLVSSLSYSGDWELLATALRDAVGGDASAVASLASTESGSGAEADGDPADAFDVANIVIYCADFRHVITRWSYCDGLPVNAETLEPVSAVDISTPALVIGTEFDPSTPGKHAPAFADALGDAVAISWAGVGHTAFPAPTRCLDDAVVDYLLDATVPEDRLACPFLDAAGVDPTDEEIADILFGHGDAKSERWLRDVFEFGFETPSDTARCAARELNGYSDEVISHVVLDVTSADADEALSEVFAAC